MILTLRYGLEEEDGPYLYALLSSTLYSWGGFYMLALFEDNYPEKYTMIKDPDDLWSYYYRFWRLWMGYQSAALLVEQDITDTRKVLRLLYSLVERAEENPGPGEVYKWILPVHIKEDPVLMESIEQEGHHSATYLRATKFWREALCIADGRLEKVMREWSCIARKVSRDSTDSKTTWIAKQSDNPPLLYQDWHTLEKPPTPKDFHYHVRPVSTG